MSPTNSSIKDVARRAGVSIATVSHVLNNTKHVSDKTRDRVLKAVEGLQYHPNQEARSLRLGQERNIFILVETSCVSSIAASSILICFTAKLQKLHNRVITQYFSSFGQAVLILEGQNYSSTYIFTYGCADQEQFKGMSDLFFFNFDLEKCSEPITGSNQLNLGFFFYSEINDFLEEQPSSQVIMNYRYGKTFNRLFPDHNYSKIYFMNSEISAGFFFMDKFIHTERHNILFADYSLFTGAVKYFLQNENLLYQCSLNINYQPWFRTAELYGLPLNIRPFPKEKILQFILGHLSV